MAADSAGSDGLQVLDVDTASTRYRRVIVEAMLGTIGTMPHHIERRVHDGVLFANSWKANRTWIFDVRDPVSPAIRASFGSADGVDDTAATPYVIMPVAGRDRAVVGLTEMGMPDHAPLLTWPRAAGLPTAIVPKKNDRVITFLLGETFSIRPAYTRTGTSAPPSHSPGIELLGYNCYITHTST